MLKSSRLLEFILSQLFTNIDCSATDCQNFGKYYVPYFWAKCLEIAEDQYLRSEAKRIGHYSCNVQSAVQYPRLQQCLDSKILKESSLQLIPKWRKNRSPISPNMTCKSNRSRNYPWRTGGQWGGEAGKIFDKGVENLLLQHASRYKDTF